ncbi:MAG: type II secretion system protein GspD [Limnobacter sp.]|uniref:type II secretion system protein GspD n=1 Tax=Limnobacter sp. TaxID=2003368 RepID=UPI00391B2A33
MKPQTVLNTKRRLTTIGVYVAMASTLAACAPIRPFPSTKAVRESIKQPELTVPTPNLPTMTLPIERMPEDTFWVKPNYSQGELPVLMVRNLSVTERGLFDVLQILLANTNMPLAFEGGPESAARYGVVTLNNLNGPLPDVMNKLGEIMGFFWTVSDSGVLRIMPEQQFVVPMPPVLNEDSMAGITNTLQYLGARDVFLDRINRSLVFRANRRALTDIRNYLDRARATRSLIVYDMNVLQVDLNDSNNMGIRWELYKSGGGLNAGLDSPVAGASSTARALSQVSRTSTGVETLIFGENFQSSFLIDFLRTQGDVKTLSQPKIGLMNGTNGSIRVGQSTAFVARVGSQIINGVAQSTADTQLLRTGLELSLTGEAHDATIYTRINISITELLALKKFTALGVDLNLPEVADRELKTQVRCRPGDTILLGGITVSRSQDDFQKGLGILSRTDAVKQTELVITISPKLLRFDELAKADTRMPQQVPSRLDVPSAKELLAPPRSESPAEEPPVVSTPAPVRARSDGKVLRKIDPVPLKMSMTLQRLPEPYWTDNTQYAMRAKR